MPYEYLEEIAIADVAFRAWSKTLEDLFVEAAEATLNVMLEDPGGLRERVHRDLHVRAESVEMLLFELLQELIYWKDAERLLLRVSGVEIASGNGEFSLTCRGRGETIDPQRHNLLADVKAVTFHRFRVRETSKGWEASVVLDI